MGPENRKEAVVPVITMQIKWFISANVGDLICKVLEQILCKASLSKQTTFSASAKRSNTNTVLYGLITVLETQKQQQQNKKTIKKKYNGNIVSYHSQEKSCRK